MKQNRLLIERLCTYEKEDIYPFHMPGHKRKLSFPNPFSVDITEIEGFDNLHYPQSILKDSMKWASNIYKSDKTYYLVNGSSCGLLAAISASTGFGGKILISRNCHKSVYHGVFLNRLKTKYIYPQNIERYDINGGLLTDEIEMVLKKDKEVEAVLIVSPTYEGIVSDIKRIAEIVHHYGIPLIVDEAHGAHFSFNGGCPESALQNGADIVIQSVHKTLPSLTQTALIHVKSKIIDIDKLEFYLSIYQTTSPSYILLSSIENCISIMNESGMCQLERLYERLSIFRKRMKILKNLTIMDDQLVNTSGIKDIDLTKIVISTKTASITGVELSDLLRNKYRIEMEMSSRNYVVGITTICDHESGFERLERALIEIDKELEYKSRIEYHFFIKVKQKIDIFTALENDGEAIAFESCSGKISKEYIYLYPPGIPIIVPGELLQEEIIKEICLLKKMGLSVEGTVDKKLKKILVLK